MNLASTTYQAGSILLPTAWSQPEFNFGDRVRWRGAEGELGWYGVVVGMTCLNLDYPAFWEYTVEIDSNSPLVRRLGIESTLYDSAIGDRLELTPEE